MKQRLKFLLPLFIFVFILFFFWWGLGRDPNLLPSMLVNKPIPAFSYPSLIDSGTSVTSNQFKHKVVLLNVFASWCDNCQIEQPILMDLARKNKLDIYGIDYKDDRNQALKFLASYGNPYVDIIDDHQGKLAMQLGVYGTPETFLIDKQGVVRYRFVGPITINVLEHDLIPNIKNLLEESN